jgi:transketolase
MSQEPAAFATEPIEKLVPNTIRTLTMDAVEKAKSGHCGLPMGCADFAFVLWTKYLKLNPANPHWANRDRFVLSAGHGSMLIYSLLHLAGFEKMTLDQLKQFRQWGSLTPGHPESHETEGVEVTTGPLGQGTGNSVGLAIGQKFFAATFNTPDFTVSDHKVYAIVSDGDLQEGVSHEAAALAGHLGLDNLVWFYDDNSVSIEGMTKLSYSDDVPSRFAGYHWHVISINGNDQTAIDAALKEAHATKGRPTIIIGKTVIGFGSPKLQGTPKAHSDAFGPEEVAATKRALGWPEDSQFLVPQKVKDFFAGKRKVWAQEEADWKKLFADYKARNPEKARLWQDFLDKKLPENLESLLPKYPVEKPIATRNAGGDVLKVLFGAVPNLLGGSADLAPSTKTWIKEFGSFEKGNYGGRNLHFGIREHGMGAICNGMALYGGIIPYGATFLIFSDYMRPPIRLAALSKLQSIFVFTHDSIFLGEDGPTHQPIEQLAALRAIPGLEVWRPADPIETAASWAAALTRKEGPSLLSLTRQKLAPIALSGPADVNQALKGAYIVSDSEGAPELVVIATGSEVATTQAALKLLEPGLAKKTRFISMPCTERFLAWPKAEQDKLVPPPAKCAAVEAAGGQDWYRIIGRGLVVGIPGYGASAPEKALAEAYGFTPAKVAAKLAAFASGAEG